MIRNLMRHRDLIFISVKRDIQSRYKGSVFGLLWSFINPLVLLLVYTFVFSVVFKAKWGIGGDDKTEFALVLFAGLIIFNFFSDCIIRSPGLILANPNYVKKIVFPLDILPVVSVISSLYHLAIGIFIWALVYIAVYGSLQLTLIYLPVIIIPFVLFALGVTWIIAALGVYIRDIGQFAGSFVSVLMFLTPIFYPSDALPESYKFFIYLNPLSYVVETFRDVMYWGKAPNALSLACYWIFSLFLCCLGHFFFSKLRKGFADVI